MRNQIFLAVTFFSCNKIFFLLQEKSSCAKKKTLAFTKFCCHFIRWVLNSPDFIKKPFSWHQKTFNFLDLYCSLSANERKMFLYFEHYDPMSIPIAICCCYFDSEACSLSGTGLSKFVSALIHNFQIGVRHEF